MTTRYPLLAALLLCTQAQGCSISSGTPVDDDSEVDSLQAAPSSGGSSPVDEGGASGGAPSSGPGGAAQQGSDGSGAAAASSGGSPSEAELPTGLRLNEMTRGSAAFVEIVNEGDEALELQGVGLTFGQGAPDFAASCALDGTRLEPGEYLVVTKRAECPVEWGLCLSGCDISPSFAETSLATSDQMFLLFEAEILDEVSLPSHAEFPTLGTSWSRLSDDIQWAGRLASPGEANDD